MKNEFDNTVRPLVSVVIPAYNAERFIRETITSVISQTYGNWELWVIDDGSTDSTCEIVEEFAKRDERIRLVKNETNVGVANTRNRGFDLCRGSYVALLDSDDVWFPDKLARQLALARETGADIIYCSYKMIDETGREVCDDFIVSETADFESCLIRSEISCSTAFFSRKIIENYRFCAEYYHEDLVLWLHLLRDGYVAKGVVDVLAAYRFLQSGRSSKKIRSAINRWRIYRRCLKLSIFKSMRCIGKYAFLGIRKYKKK